MSTRVHERGPGAGSRAGRAPHAVVAFAGILVALTVDNYLTNRVLPSAWYVPTRLVTTGVVLLLGLELARLRWNEIGFDRSCCGRGLTWGVLAFAVEAIVLIVLAGLPQTRDLFDDRRVQEHLGGPGLVDQVLWQIPLGTVLLEEVAFRGVLLALFLRRLTLTWAVVASSILFGLWHILPSAGLTTFNPIFAGVGDNAAGRASAVFVAIVVTAGVGVALCWLRLRAGHLIAPIIAHAGGNAFAFTISWILLEPR